MAWVALATEDELSEVVGFRLIAETPGRLTVNLMLRRGGNGYLRSRISNFCQMARHQPVVLITDLDQETCPKTLKDSWLVRQRIPENLLFRVAVREIEAWLLADHEAISALIGSKVGRLPANPDHLQDPKASLLALAKKAPRKIRNDLIVQRGSIAAQGLGYNAVLALFVQKQWSPDRAAARSESLRRARARIEELAERA